MLQSGSLGTVCRSLPSLASSSLFWLKACPGSQGIWPGWHPPLPTGVGLPEWSCGWQCPPTLVVYVNHEQDLLVGRTNQMPRGGGGVPHHGLQIQDVVPCYCCGRSSRNGGKDDLKIALHKLFHGQMIVFFPVSSLVWPNFLVIGDLLV